MKIKFNEALCFDDILLVPQYSEIESRKQIDLTSILHDEMELTLPIISSPMDTVTGKDMAIAMSNMGGLGVIHRFNTIEEQVKIVKEIYESRPNFNTPLAAAIGVTDDWLNRAKQLYNSGINILCLDVAHGDHVLVERAIKTIKDDGLLYPVHIMAGNVATAEGFENLQEWGTDSIRVGIGGGSICSTRLNTGHGVPNLQALMDCVSVAEDAKVILDGGIKNAGDCVKAFALGADFIMAGSLLAGTTESPGSIIFRLFPPTEVKEYRGMASREAQKSTNKSYSIEGISTYVPHKGSAEVVLRELEENIKSGLSYSGARNLKELRKKAKFIKQTTLAQRESDTHILFNNNKK